MLTLVRFIRNNKSNSTNSIITRSLGKVGVIKSSIYHDMLPKPKQDEFWYVEIIEEVGEGKNEGCFILKPIKRIETVWDQGYSRPNIHKLIPGTFRTEKRGRTLLIYPPKVGGLNGPNWVLDSETKNFLLHCYKNADGSYAINGLIVVLDRQTIKREEKPIIDLEAINLNEEL